MQLNREKCAMPKNLDELFADDQLGIFADVKPQKAHLPSDTLSQNFAEILDFVETYGREPQTAGDFNEKRLARRLAALRENAESCKKLAEFDRLQLLSTQTESGQAVENTENVTKNPTALSLDEIFQSDEFGLLDMGDHSILNLEHIPLNNPKTIGGYEGEEIGKRTTCHDFERFKPTFYWLHEKLAAKKLVSTPAISEKIKKGDCFIVQGMLCVVVEQYAEKRQSDRENTRLRVIFENGTESNMLARSLSVLVRKDEAGKRLMFADNSDYKSFQEKLFGKLTGYIYVIKLAEPKAELTEFRHLYKIGFTTTMVEDRIKHCETDTAFLESKVEKVLSCACFNLEPHKLESLIHGFFAPCRLNLTLISKNGNAYQPQEWFDVPLETIKTAVLRILDGTIGVYRLDLISRKIVMR